MTDDYSFFKTTMPDSRKADYYLGCLDGSVFMDFNNCEDKRICLKRISFDGYGCCDLGNLAIPMNANDSQAFKELVDKPLLDSFQLTKIINETLALNKRLIWEDALMEYELL